jgi:pimeloyl-ACP methyl ester carboxylesterase
MRQAWNALWIAIAVAVVAGIGFLVRPVSYFDGWMYFEEELSGVESHWVQVDGHRMHYLAEGPAGGPVVVLVHGLGGRAEDWRNLAPYLAKAGFRVYMPDLIGFGRSDCPKYFPYSVHEEAAVAVDFLDAMGLKQVDLGGWSMGGWVAQLVAVEHPERISRLILFDSAGLAVKPAWDPALFTPTTAAELVELNALLTPHPRPVPGFVARDILRLSRANDWVMQRTLTKMFTAEDVTDKLLPELKMPVLLVWGAEDHIVPLDQAETMHRLIPQSQLDAIAGCGHLAPLECTAQIGPKVVQFVRQ